MPKGGKPLTIQGFPLLFLLLLQIIFANLFFGNKFNVSTVALLHQDSLTQSYQVMHALHLLTLCSLIDFLIHLPL